jgi:hypothetical protein
MSTESKRPKSNLAETPTPAGGFGQMPDRNAFAEKLADLMMARRAKTQQFVTEADLDALAEDCTALWKNPRREEAFEILDRLMNNSHYLAVAGNWAEFLELFGLSRQEWDRRSFQVHSRAPLGRGAVTGRA